MKKASLTAAVATLWALWHHLTYRRKTQFYLLFFLMLLGGVAESFSLGLVVPFLVAMSAPEKIFCHPWFVALNEKVLKKAEGSWFGWQSLDICSNNLAPLLATLFIIAALAVGLIRLLLLLASVRLSRASGTDLSLEVYRRILHQPYKFHVDQNSSNLISSLISKVSMVSLTLSFWLTLITSCILVGFIGAMLFVISPKTTLTAAVVLLTCYGIMAWISNRWLSGNSRVLSEEHNLLVKSLQEGLGGIRDILLDGTQEIYAKGYHDADVRFRRANANITVIGQSPRFILEPLGMVLFAALAVVLAQDHQDLVSALPILGALALGAQRLLPALQQGYSAFSMILAYQESNREVLGLLKLPFPTWAGLPSPSPMPLRSHIRFEAVQFRYAPQAPLILDGLTFTIAKGSRTGFVGKTGSGKSTCLDLLMGLLEPTEGRIMIDNRPLTQGNLRAWQRNLAHVPQAIYLADTSIAENIAFGVPPNQIDMGKVTEAARQAHIADFIESSPYGYSALVGERGIRLSGGQRQRIGIARALYKQAKVLVFDEATSALDGKTEAAVIEAISSLSRDLTILIIAHRTSTLQICDQIIELSVNLDFAKKGRARKTTVNFD